MLEADDVTAPENPDGDDLDTAALLYADRWASASTPQRADLRERFTRHCLPFAGRLAHRYHDRGEPLEDLEQVARLGLVKAIDGYRPERGSFSAYAYVTICGELKRHFRDRTWAVRVPRRLQDLALQVRRATEDLTSTLSRQPTAAEIAGRLGVSADTVVDGQRTSACYTSRSLNLPTPGGGEFADLLGAPDTDLELVDDQVTVAHLLLNLPLRERRMLALRFYGDYTQSEIAAVMGVSQMHVSRLLSRALGWLREAMLNDHPPPWRGGGDGPDRAGVQVRLLRRGTVITVRVHGEIERDTAAQLHTGLHSALAQTASRVVVDLSGVPLLDAAGVAVLLNAVHTADAVPVHLTIAGARPYVARILAVSGLPHLMSREDRTSRRQPGGRDDPPSRTRR